MKITAISAQVRNPDRVNVSIDGKYKLSLDITQVTDLGIKVGREIDEVELANLEQESQFGKLYARTLEYCLARPRSVREVNNYLRRKTAPTRVKSIKTGEIVERPGMDWSIAERVVNRLIGRSYLDDQRFAEYWVENRFLRKGISARRLKMELLEKGVDGQTIELALQGTDRSDKDELIKLIDKKRSRYPDDQKLIQYLARQGFNFDDIKAALSSED